MHWCGLQSMVSYVKSAFLVLEPIKVKNYSEAIKLHTKLSGPLLQNEGEGKNVFCIHIDVKHIEVSCLMNYYLRWR